MNKDEFNIFLQTNLDHYDQFILEGIKFFTNKYSGDSEKAKDRITEIWNENLNTHVRSGQSKYSKGSYSRYFLG